ncbi:pullulanase [Mycobacterium sp. 21AC1]|uniref:pullulanase n=1 Tax=[Mycobacterium] appelbergii TaxID=2939269 RepID=UPI002938CF33|nr:pullulanase [Mycobacterium sp. 21AC1]MDV3123406.1 pullulanase [Mycobacterium sp. 21AC1]
MDYCLGEPDGSATMWSAPPTVDLDGDGQPDGVGLDFDGDGRFDDVMADLDGDGLAEQSVRDLDDDGSAESYFTDDGSGTWAVRVDRSGQVRWFGLDGVEVGQPGGPLVDFDGDGALDDRLLDADSDGLADRVLAGETAYADTDGDGRWDVKLADTDGDGRADSVS